MKYLYLNDNFKLYTVEDLQKILKISRSFAYKLVNSGELKCVRMHKLIRISPWAIGGIHEFLFSRGKPCTDGWRRSLFRDSVQYYTIQELQTILQIGDCFIRQLLNNGEIKRQTL